MGLAPAFFRSGKQGCVPAGAFRLEAGGYPAGIAFEHSASVVGGIALSLRPARSFGGGAFSVLSNSLGLTLSSIQPRRCSRSRLWFARYLVTRRKSWSTQSGVTARRHTRRGILVSGRSTSPARLQCPSHHTRLIIPHSVAGRPGFRLTSHGALAPPSKRGLLATCYARPLLDLNARGSLNALRCLRSRGLLCGRSLRMRSFSNASSERTRVTSGATSDGRVVIAIGSIDPLLNGPGSAGRTLNVCTAGTIAGPRRLASLRAVTGNV